MIAHTAALTGGDDWLDAVLAGLAENRRLLGALLGQHLREAGYREPEGTYLAWLDCRALGLNQQALERFFIEKAGVGLSSGTHFGAEGEGFMRINLAAPRSRVREALARIGEAVKNA